MKVVTKSLILAILQALAGIIPTFLAEKERQKQAKLVEGLNQELNLTTNVGSELQPPKQRKRLSSPRGKLD